MGLNIGWLIPEHFNFCCLLKSVSSKANPYQCFSLYSRFVIAVWWQSLSLWTSHIRSDIIYSAPEIHTLCTVWDLYYTSIIHILCVVLDLEQYTNQKYSMTCWINMIACTDYSVSSIQHSYWTCLYCSK